jgi:hypothetical protein
VAFPQSFQADTPIVLDPASPLYSYLNGQGALWPYVQGTDDVSHAAYRLAGPESFQPVRLSGWDAD